MATSPIKLVFPDDVESHEQFIHFRLAENYKFRREEIAKGDLYATITIPLPAGLTTSYSANYTSEGLGIIGEGAAKMGGKFVESAIGAFNQAKTDIPGAIDNLKGIVGNVAGADWTDISGKLARYYIPEIAKEGGALVGGKIGGIGGAAIGAAIGSAVKGAQVGMGQARNPYLAAVFEGIGFKTHNFQFQLNPKNKNESDQLALIISSFRNAMLPSLKSQAEVYYDYPKQIDIRFFDESYLFDIKTSVCTQFDVNYHGKGAYYHDVNGRKAPVEVTLNTTFLETSVRLSGDEVGRSSQYKVSSPKDRRLNNEISSKRVDVPPIPRPRPRVIDLTGETFIRDTFNKGRQFIDKLDLNPFD